MYEYPATLVRVIDGDTYVFDIDLGFRVVTRQHVRLAGIDCPEHATPEGKAATEAARLWFWGRSGECVLRTTKVPHVTFDRWVAEVLDRDDNGPDLTHHLRGLGHVKSVERLGK